VGNRAFGEDSWVEVGFDFLIHGSNNRKAIKENTKPNSQKALGSLTSTVLDVGAQSAIGEVEEAWIPSSVFGSDTLAVDPKPILTE